MQQLETLKKKLLRIIGEWNGDESGIQEDRAHIANEMLEHIAALEKLEKELDESY